MCVSMPMVLADWNECYDQHGEPSLTTMGYR